MGGLDSQAAALQGRLDSINDRLDSLALEADALNVEKQQILDDLGDISAFHAYKEANVKEAPLPVLRP